MTPQETNLTELTGLNQIGFNIALNKANENELSEASDIIFSKIGQFKDKLRECGSIKQSNVYLMIIKKMERRMQLITNRLIEN